MLAVYQRIYLFLVENRDEFVKYNDSSVVVAIQANSRESKVYPYKVYKSQLLTNRYFQAILSQQPTVTQQEVEQALTNATENCLIVEVDDSLLYLFYNYTLKEVYHAFR